MPSLSCAPAALREERDLEDDLPTVCNVFVHEDVQVRGVHGCERVWLECVEKRCGVICGLSVWKGVCA